MSLFPSLERLQQQVVRCRLCPRLVEYRRSVASVKRRQFADWTYWGKPVPGFGDPQARLLVVGLAPAAHGGNRTGRVFTGDRSGDWLYEALFQFGMANQPSSTHRDDGLALDDCYIAASVRCAPPGNKPLPEEFQACRPYLIGELQLLTAVKVVVALGKIAFDQYLKAAAEMGHRAGKPAPRFAHAAIHVLPWGVTLIASYHPSQQNTFTGKLTRPMFHRVFAQARQVLENEMR